MYYKLIRLNVYQENILQFRIFNDSKIRFTALKLANDDTMWTKKKTQNRLPLQKLQTPGAKHPPTMQFDFHTWSKNSSMDNKTLTTKYKNRSIPVRTSVFT